MYDGNLRLAVSIYTCGVPITVRNLYKIIEKPCHICNHHLTLLSAQRITDMGRLMSLKLPSERTLRETISKYAVPAASEFYDEHMGIVQSIVKNLNVRNFSFLEKRQNAKECMKRVIYGSGRGKCQGEEGIDVGVDGRYDSPGFCASNCTVDVIDMKTDLIVEIQNLNVTVEG